MSAPETAPSVTTAVIEQTAERLAHAHGIAAPQVVWVDDDRGARSHLLRNVIEMPIADLDDAELALWSVAHEVGHLVHDAPRRRHDRRKVAIGVAAMFVVFGLVAWALLPAWGPLALPTAAAAAYPIMWVLIRQIRQASERAADRFAAHAGYPLTARVASNRRASEPLWLRLCGLILPAYPSWPERVTLSAQHHE